MMNRRVQATAAVAALAAIGTCHAFVLRPSFVPNIAISCPSISLRDTNKKEDAADEILICQDAAAFDTNDDKSEMGGMSAFFELAHEIADDLHHLKEEQHKHQQASWNEQHLAHSASELHEETASELRESEEAAAWDAHDCSDPGMEAAAEERAVMLANELVHKKKEQATSQKEKQPNWNDEHLAHAASELHEETASELRESEEAAAWDAHDCSDPGMEAAAEERAVMLANELMHKAKAQAKQKKEDKSEDVRP